MLPNPSFSRICLTKIQSSVDGFCQFCNASLIIHLLQQFFKGYFLTMILHVSLKKEGRRIRNCTQLEFAFCCRQEENKVGSCEKCRHLKETPVPDGGIPHQREMVEMVRTCAKAGWRGYHENDITYGCRWNEESRQIKAEMATPCQGEYCKKPDDN